MTSIQKGFSTAELGTKIWSGLPNAVVQLEPPAGKEFPSCTMGMLEVTPSIRA